MEDKKDLTKDSPKEEKKKKPNKVEELQNTIAELTVKMEGLKNEYFKAYADTENMKKRLQADFDTRNKYRIQSFATEILPAIDNLERALENSNEEDPIYQGVKITLDQIKLALKNEGVEEIEALNLPFDANCHQALMTEHKEGVEPGMVIEVLQKGYKLKDRILRASLVKVSE